MGGGNKMTIIKGISVFMDVQPWSREDKTGVKWMERVGGIASKLVGSVFVKDESWPIMRIV